MVSALYDHRLIMRPALRRREVCIAISAALIAVLGFATVVHLALLGSMRPDVASVFFRALALSGLLAALPLGVLWLLERRERQTPWLFAAAFLWGACIATGLALPFNSAFLELVDAWLPSIRLSRSSWGRMRRCCWRRRFPRRSPRRSPRRWECL